MHFLIYLSCIYTLYQTVQLLNSYQMNPWHWSIEFDFIYGFSTIDINIVCWKFVIYFYIYSFYLT